MSIERPGGGPEPGLPGAIAGGRTDGEGASPALRLQILATEHWSLLATRSLTWSEAFSRAAMFLSALTGGVVALALVAQATSFGEGFMLFALVLLPVLLFLGLTTFVRLVEINAEDVHWVAGMNRLRHAYLEQAPELEPYFITGWHDDERGVQASADPATPWGTWLHATVTTPGMIGVVVAVVGGALAGVAGLQIGGMGVTPVLQLSVGAFLVILAALALSYVRIATRRMRRYRPRFPSPASAREG